MNQIMTPGRIGPITARNRIVMPAMQLNYTMDGSAGPQLIEFYRRRAAGGVGTIIVGGCTTGPLAGPSFMLSLQHDGAIEGVARLAEAIRREGAVAGAQLYHAGRYVHQVLIGDQQPVSSSAVPSSYTRETPVPLDRDGIAATVEEYALAAGRAVEAGFQLVEVLAGTGYLIAQFLSAVVNRRDDEYGGSLENRMRFGLEIARAVRARIGSRTALAFRIAGNDFMPGGGGLAESATFARALEREGVDLIDVTGGWHETRVPQLTTFVPEGAYLYLARAIKQAVSVPVAASNRYNRPRLAREVIHYGMADFVCLGRPLIADPDLPAKLAEDRDREVRRCVACGQGCFDRVFALQPVTCLCNPAAGHEHEPVPTGGERRRFLVVGAGPAGMTAALELDRLGHHAVLIDRKPQAGGEFALAPLSPGREELALFLEDGLGMLERSGVELRLGTPLDRELLDRLRPEAVIVATGGSPVLPPIPGIERACVLTARDILTGRAVTGRRVAVIGGGAVGLEVAIHLARIGTPSSDTLRFLLENRAEPIETLQRIAVSGTLQVTVLEMLSKTGQGIGRSTRWNFFQEAERLGVSVVTGARVTEIGDGLVRWESGEGGGELEVDSVVVAAGYRPDTAAAALVRESGHDYHVIGDAHATGDAFGAVTEAYDLVRRLVCLRM